MTTLRDVAERAGVSAAVVSAAISGSKSVRMSEATRARVEEAIRETGYRTNHAARALKTQRTGIVSAIVPKIVNPVFDQALQGIQDAADEAQGVVIVSDSERLVPGSNLMSRLVGTGMAEGFIVRSVQLGDETIDEFEQRGIPCVVMNGPSDGRHTCVWVDDRAGIAAATGHLLDLGHRRIAMVGGPLEPYTRDSRREGYELAFTSRGLAVPDAGVHAVGYQPEVVQGTVTALMRDAAPPTAVIIDNVLAGFAAMAAAVDLGLRIPDDLSMIAYHDIPQAGYVRPGLTTVKMPVYEAGYRGYKALLRMIEGRPGRSALVARPAPKIISRQSTTALV